MGLKTNVKTVEQTLVQGACGMVGLPEQHHSCGWLLEIGIRQSQHFSDQFLWETPIPFQSKHSIWNNLSFLCMIFPRIWILRNLRGLRSLLVKTGHGIHTQWCWRKHQYHWAPEESCCCSPESLRLAHNSSEAGFSKLDMVLRDWVQWKDYVTFLADKYL